MFFNLKKTNSFKKFLALIFKNIMIITTFSLFFLPFIFSITIEKSCFFFNYFFILKNKGFLVSNTNFTCFVSFPVLLKISLTCSIFLSFFGFVFYILNKFKVSAILHLTSAICFFSLIFSLNKIRNDILNFNFSINSVFFTISWSFLIFSFLEFLNALHSILKCGVEKLTENIFFICCAIAILIVICIIGYVFVCGAPAILKIGVLNFVLNSKWAPQTNEFGIFNLIISSIFATLGALFLAAPIGILTATFLAEFINKKVTKILTHIIEILASIPSVIYGFLGMNVLVPLIKKIFITFEKEDGLPIVGDSLLAVILVLFIMILPTIVSTSLVSLNSVPKSFKYASLNLGATKIQTIFKVNLKAARSGIFSGILLAICRAIGETMAVMMVAGNVVNFPKLLSPVRLLTTGIAVDMAYSSGLFRQALFGIGLVLFALIIIINFSFNKIIKKFSWNFKI